MDRLELAWAAGFFDGEGWANAVRADGRRTSQPQARINQADAHSMPSTLVRFHRAVGNVGRLGGPQPIVGRLDTYWWSASSRADVERLYRLLRPWLCYVKTAQLERALGSLNGSAHSPVASEELLAWAAGLFDGEGCSALLRHRSHAGYFTPELSVTQSSRVGSPEVLERFRNVVGRGAISGPYTQRNATMDVYRWKASAREDVEQVIGALWPFLDRVKRAQAQRLLDTLAAQPKLPRGNPAFGYHKTQCVHGHEYTTARLRPFVARHGGEAPRVNQKCLACLREYAQRLRDAKRLAANDDRGTLGEPDYRYDYLLK